MNEIPTREQIRATASLDHLLALAYMDGDLMTRAEAAADPEVQRTVFDNWQVRQAWDRSRR